MMKCIESWSSRSCPVSALLPYSTHAILALLWIYLTFTRPKVFSKSQISSKKLDRGFWALYLRMLVETLEVCYRLPLASSRKRQQVQTPIRRQKRPRHLRQMLSCGLAARILKLRKSTYELWVLTFWCFSNKGIFLIDKTQLSLAKLPGLCPGRLLLPWRRTPNRVMCSCWTASATSSRASTHKSRSWAAAIRWVSHPINPDISVGL